MKRITWTLLIFASMFTVITYAASPTSKEYVDQRIQYLQTQINNLSSNTTASRVYGQLAFHPSASENDAGTGMIRSGVNLAYNETLRVQNTWTNGSSYVVTKLESPNSQLYADPSTGSFTIGANGAGDYLITYNAFFWSPTNQGAIVIVKNSSAELPAGGTIIASSSWGEFTYSISVIATLAAGDSIAAGFMRGDTNISGGTFSLWNMDLTIVKL